MSLDTQSLLPRGIYRIVVAQLGQIGPDALTRADDKGVSILPPGVRPDEEQKWLIEPCSNGNVIITTPTGIRPPTALTYEGAPEKAQEGQRVIYRVQEFGTEWHVGIAPGFRQTLQVPNTRLGIAVAPPMIHPPFLELREREQLFWIFERVGEAP